MASLAHHKDAFALNRAFVSCCKSSGWPAFMVRCGQRLTFVMRPTREQAFLEAIKLGIEQSKKNGL